MELDIKKNITTINQWTERFDFKIKGIVLHSMVGTQRGTVAWFKNPKAKVSAHYCVGADGEIVLTVEEKSAAWHAGNVTTQKDKAPKILVENWGVNPNMITIGIEMEDKKDKNWAYPQKQYSACVLLVSDICRRYNIPMDRGHVFMHKESDPVNKSDPIGKWEHDKFMEDVRIYGEKGGVKDNEEKLYPYRTVVKILDWVDTLYVREGAAKIYPLSGTKTLKRGNEVEVVGFVKGERIVYGDISTQFWWKSTKGNYFWAGATSLVPTLDNFPNGMNKVINFEGNKNMEELKANFDALAVRQEELVTELEGVRGEMARIQEEINAPVEEVVVEEPLVEEVVEELLAEMEEAVEEVESITEEAPESEEVVEVKEQVKVMSKLLEDIKAKLGL